MSEQDKIQLFEDQPIRAAWDSEQEEWYFSIVDVIRVLTDSPNPQTYWRVMKKRLKDEGNETVTNCNGLKMVAADGKRRMTGVATTEQLHEYHGDHPEYACRDFHQGHIPKGTAGGV